MNIKLLAEFVNKAVKVKRLIEQSSSMEDKAITMLQFQALDLINSNKEITVGHLSKALSMSLSSTTQLTNRLADANLVERKTNKDDRRVVFISTSEKGNSEIKAFKKQSVSRQFKIFTSIPEKDMMEMVRIFTKIIDSNT